MIFIIIIIIETGCLDQAAWSSSRHRTSSQRENYAQLYLMLIIMTHRGATGHICAGDLF